MRYFAAISYNGSGFSGWQTQANAVSVQALIEQAFSIILAEKITVTGAGRTDAGVNASRMIAHFDTSSDILPSEHERLIYKINAILPKGIALHSLTRVRDDAHARFDACSRTYKYFLHTRKDPLAGEFSWYCRFPLDMEAMNRGAAYLIGRKDFRCFEKKGSQPTSGVCEITSAAWSLQSSQTASPGTEQLVFTISANRFLRNMVRSIVGTLVEVGRGKKDPQWVETLLQTGDRGQAGESVPGHALFLTAVDYPKDIIDF